MEKKPVLRIPLKKLIEGKGTLRVLGEEVRNFIENAWTEYQIIELDFENETVQSGSLFDEIVKLFDEYPKEEVKRRLKFVNIDPWDESLIVHLAKLRLTKKKKEEQFEYSN